jgi:outer membrane protein assembly factor BamB
MGSPALDDEGRIFIGTMEGAMYCLRQSDGSFVWRFDAEGGIYASPALDGNGRLYVGSVDSYLYALNSTTGALAWKFRTNAAIYSSAAIADGDAGLVYVGSTDWRLYAVRVHDGLLAWWGCTSRIHFTHNLKPPGSSTLETEIYDFLVSKVFFQMQLVPLQRGIKR